jgi:hypothetical protein
MGEATHRRVGPHDQAGAQSVVSRVVRSRPVQGNPDAIVWRFVGSPQAAVEDIKHGRAD